jgi:hypothetical protein
LQALPFRRPAVSGKQSKRSPNCDGFDSIRVCIQFRSYESKSGGKTGVLNSPRYPAAYPIELQCEYRLQPLPNEHVMLMFSAFKLHQPETISFGYGRHVCDQDWLEMYATSPADFGSAVAGDPLILALNSSFGGNRKGNFLGRWCGHSAPGPVLLSPPIRQLLLLFNSNAHGAGSGFKANYEFVRHAPLSQCPSTKLTKVTLHGFITSPGYPKAYAANDSWCQATVRVRPGYRVLLHFVQFSVEGDMKRKR